MIERRRKFSVNDSYGGVFVYNLSGQLLEQYAFEVSDVLKGRGAYICITENGKKIIKAYDASEIRAEALCLFLQEVKAKGVPADSIIRTKDDKVLAADIDGTTYYARDYIEGRECETKTREDVLASMGALARFHNCMNGYEGEIPEGMRVSPDMLVLEYEKHNRELKKVRNYVRGKKSKNEFEMIFWRSHAAFLEKAQKVTEKLHKQMEEVQGMAWSQMEGICHGDFNQHNVLFVKDNVWITNFEASVYDVQMRDLANFLRKIMEKYNWNLELAVDMIHAYEKERTLARQEWEQLYIRLSYPEKFWKIANHYYNSNKAWISGRNIEKLNKVIEQEEQREHFLNMLFSFVK